MRKQAAIVAAALFFLISFFLTPTSLAQDGHYDVAINGAGVFTKQSDGNGIAQSATVGLNVFATVRVKLNDKHSLAFNYGRAKDSQTYQENFDFHVPSQISEFSGAYVYSPFQKGRFAPFVLAGAGALVFNPLSTWIFLPEVNDLPNNVQTNVGARRQTEVAFLYGLGVDYQLPRFSRFALRLQYRGLIYRAPDFDVNTGTSTVNFFTGARGHMAEPSVGLVFRF